MSRTESPPTPPPTAPHLKGEVCVQYIRCNKAGCRCQDGRTHGPYYYRVWREAGRVHKEYVKAKDLEATRAACDSYRTHFQALRDLRRRREQLGRDIQGEWGRARRLLRRLPAAPPTLRDVSAAGPPPPPRTAS